MCKFAAVNFLVCTSKAVASHHQPPKPSIVLSHGLSRIASRKDCNPAVRDYKPRLWSLPTPMTTTTTIAVGAVNG